MTDEDWFNEQFLPRLGKCLDSGDTIARLVLFREARKRDGLRLCVEAMECVLPRLDGAEAAKKMAVEITERLKATNNVNVKARDVSLDGNALLGVDASGSKSNKAKSDE